MKELSFIAMQISYNSKLTYSWKTNDSVSEKNKFGKENGSEYDFEV